MATPSLTLKEKAKVLKELFALSGKLLLPGRAPPKFYKIVPDEGDDDGRADNALPASLDRPLDLKGLADRLDRLEDKVWCVEREVEAVSQTLEWTLAGLAGRDDEQTEDEMRTTKDVGTVVSTSSFAPVPKPVRPAPPPPPPPPPHQPWGGARPKTTSVVVAPSPVDAWSCSAGERTHS